MRPGRKTTYGVIALLVAVIAVPTAAVLHIALTLAAAYLDDQRKRFFEQRH